MGESFAGIAVPEGDPDALSAAASELSGVAGALEGVSAELGSMPGALSSWRGSASVSFAGSCVTNGAVAEAGTVAMDTAAAATRRFSDELEVAQREARRAIEQARDAKRRIERAQAEIEAAQDRASEASARHGAASTRVLASGLTGAPDAGAMADQARAERDEADAHAVEAKARRELEQAREDLQDAQKRGQRAEQGARDAAQQAAGALAAIAGTSPAAAVPGTPAAPAAAQGQPLSIQNVSYSPPITGGEFFGGPEGQKKALKLAFDPGAILDGISALFTFDFKRALDKLTDGLGGAKSKGPKKLAKEAWDWLKGHFPSRKPPKPGNKPPAQPPHAPKAAIPQESIDEAVRSSARVGKGGQVQEGARAIAKKQGQGASPFAGVPPTQSQAEAIIRDILKNPTVVDRGDRVIDVYNAAGQGVRLRRDTGAFQGFLDVGRRHPR